MKWFHSMGVEEAEEDQVAQAEVAMVAPSQVLDEMEAEIAAMEAQEVQK